MADLDVENLIVTLTQRGWSHRRLAREMGISRNTVRAVLERRSRERDGGHSALPGPKIRRPSLLDPHRSFIANKLAEYPDITAVRLLEELRREGFEGEYTIVRQHLRERRPKAKAAPSKRIETGPGKQGQQDWSPYKIDFTKTGRQEVQCFGLILSFSRRHLISFTERSDYYTLIRQHVAAFERFDGVPREILYDRQKAVVLGYEAGRNLYNPRFLAFATHYRFRPRALPPRKPEWKGKIERPFQYVEGNCLNARDFHDLAHLQEHAVWWMDNTSDPHPHKRTGETPLARFERERDHLRHLPLHPYDTAEVGYRIVDREGFVAWDGTPYSVPYAWLLDMVVVHAAAEVITVYSHDLQQIAEHGRAPRGQREPVCEPSHHPPKKKRRNIEALIARMTALGEAGEAFAAGICRHQRLRGVHLSAVLAHQERYDLDDVLKALQRAIRYRAFDADTVTRILETTATPRVLPDSATQAARERLRTELAHTDIAPRELSAYAAAFRGETDPE